MSNVSSWTRSRTPRLEIYPDRIRHNAAALVHLCHQRGVQVAGVTKALLAHEAVARAMVAGGVDMLADSRVQNLWRLRDQGFAGPYLLLRLPAPSEAMDVVRTADISLNSGLETLRALSAAAFLQRLQHQVILMVDLGDLREGVWPDRIVELARKGKDFPHLRVIGLGCNLACHGGVKPTRGNMNLLVSLQEACRRETGLELPILSGGNSSGIPMLAAGELPVAVNHFRLGEAILLGRDVLDRSPLPKTRQDTFIGVAEVIEVERKPTKPPDEVGQDAFGGMDSRVDRGPRLRALCNLGRQDVVVAGIQPAEPGITLVGGSSDHLVFDVEDSAVPVQVGSLIRFFPNYGALLALASSPYVHKVVKSGD